MVGAIEVSPPQPLAQGVVAARDKARLGDDDADGEFRDGRGVASRRIGDHNAVASGGRHIDVHRTAAGRDDQLETRQALEHRRRKRRQLGHDDGRAARPMDNLVGIALIFLQPIHARLGVAVPHRLVRPRQFEGLNVERPRAAGADRRFERRRRHELVADDHDPRPSS